MRRDGGRWAELGAQARLALPVVVVQVGLYAMGAVDGAFMGRVSAAQYAAISLGHSYTFVLLGFAMGTLGALDPLVSQAFGARDQPAIARAMQRGVVLALGLSALVAALCLPVGPVLRALGQPSGVVPYTIDYVRVSIVGVPGFLLFVAQRQALQAMHRMRELVGVILLANGLNVLLDWLWIRGHWGFAPMGAVGCSWATVASRWALALGLPLVAGREHLRWFWPRAPDLWRRSAFATMLRIGLPIGAQFALEIGAFASILVLMGQLGEVQLAAHQVALALASAAFMLPLGIAMAGSVRVGNAIGRGDPEGVARASRAALTLGASVMALTGALFLLLPWPLARLFTNLEPVLEVAVLLVPIAGFFGVFDGIQVVAAGCLRGMADTRVPLGIHLLGFWVVAIPSSAGLGLGLGYGARGLWWGLALGLFVTAIAQLARLRVKLRRGALARIEPGRPAAGSPGT